MRQSRTEVLTDRADQVVSLLAHPSRPFLLSGSGSKDFTVRVWDLDARSVVRTLARHTHNVWGLALCPDGKRLASGSWDNTVRLWDLESGEHLRTLAGHLSGVVAVAWEAAGSLLASGSYDNTVRLWHADSGALRRSLEGHSSAVHALAAHPNATADLLASGSEDKTVRVWRWSSGARVRTLAGHTGPVASLAASNEWLISGSWDRTLRVWSWDGFCARVLETTGQLRLNSLAWRDSKIVMLDGEDWNKPATVRVWDASSADPSAWSCVGSLKRKASFLCGVAVVGGGRVVFNAAGGLVAVALETPCDARPRRRRLAHAG